MNRPLTIFSSALTGYAALARSVGLDPANVATQAGVPLAALSSPRVVVRARCAHRLLELSAEQSGLADFGLRLASDRGLSHLGMLGLVARDEPDVRSALRRIIAGLNVHSTCSMLDLDESGGFAVLTLTLLADGEPIIRQATETAVAQLYRDLVALLGPQWRPLEVQFVHAAAMPARRHRTMFGCPVTFSSERNAVVMRAADLDSPVRGSDVGFRAHADELGSSLLSLGRKVSVDRTRRAVAVLLPQGRCTAQATARAMGVDRRTMHRHLGEAGTDFSGVVSEMRREMCERFLRAGSLSMTNISMLLGFSSPASFSRWFSVQYGCAPTLWQRRERLQQAEAAF